MGIRERVTQVPERVIVTKIDSPARVFRAQYNPNALTEALSVNYNRKKVPGLSHEVLRYVNTTNETLTVEFYLKADSREQLERNLEARKIIKSFCYPRAVSAGQGVTAGGPPRLSFFWPHLFALTSVITRLSIKHTLFNTFMEPIESTISCTIEEIRDARLLDDDVATYGTIRGAIGQLE